MNFNHHITSIYFILIFLSTLVLSKPVQIKPWSKIMNNFQQAIENSIKRNKFISLCDILVIIESNSNLPESLSNKDEIPEVLEQLSNAGIYMSEVTQKSVVDLFVFFKQEKSNFFKDLTLLIERMGGLEGSNVQDVIDHYLMAMKAIMRMDQLSGEEMEGILDKTFKSIHDIGKDTTEGMQITFNDDLIDKILQDLQECLMHKFSLDIQMRILITMKDMLTDLTKNDLSIDQGMMMLRKLKNTLKFDI